MSTAEPADAATAVEQADVAAARAVADLRDHPLTRAAGHVSELFDQPPLTALCLATIAGGLLLRDPAVARLGSRMLAAHLLAWGLKSAAKRVFDRTRPFVLVEEGRYETGIGEKFEKKHNSFPSGHTAGAVAVARAWARERPAESLPAHAVAAVAGLVQVPRCMHYPTDIGAGALVGVAAESLASRALDAITGSDPGSRSPA